MERQFFSGNTLEQAILAAARHHGLDPERVAYTLRDKKHGFVNMRRRVVIEVDPDAPELPEDVRSGGEVDADAQTTRQEARQRDESPERWHEPPKEQRSSMARSGGAGERAGASWRGEDLSWDEGGGADSAPDADRVLEALERAVDEIGKLLAVRFVSSVRRDDEGYEIELAGPESGVLREHRGNGLGAIEHLLPRMVRGLSGQGVPCRVDSEGFRAAHERELAQLALSTAEDVRRELEERRLEPMNPADRRVVHMALADHPEVITESEGQGFMKRVRIIPA
jgi:predicted RNA-binding protein Jag